MSNETQTTSVAAESPIDRLVEEVASWPEVSAHPHRFGGTELRRGRRELGHVHRRPDGSGVADLPFPRSVRDELVSLGTARPHHVLPSSGWVTAPVRGGTDLEVAIELFRMSYERAGRARRAVPANGRSTA
jgi:hypothetical protein